MLAYGCNRRASVVMCGGGEEEERKDEITFEVICTVVKITEQELSLSCRFLCDRLL